MPKANRTCKNCGKKYYVCFSCTSRTSWKNIACSQQCYREYMNKDKSIKEVVKPDIIEVPKEEMFKILFVVRNKSNKNKNIIGFDLELGKFDCDDMTTITLDDIKSFVMKTNNGKTKFVINYNNLSDVFECEDTTNIPVDEIKLTNIEKEEIIKIVEKFSDYKIDLV